MLLPYFCDSVAILLCHHYSEFFALHQLTKNIHFHSIIHCKTKNVELFTLGDFLLSTADHPASSK